MKKFTLFLFSLLIFSPAFSQENQAVWLGLDFSHSKMIGHDGFRDPVAIQSRLFDSWNNLILAESDKYDIKEAFRLKELENEIGVVKKVNETVDPDQLVQEENWMIEESQLASIIKNYDLSEFKNSSNEGSDFRVGLVFIVETFNKNEVEASFWVTAIDLHTKKILKAERMQGKPGGFGIRNYWARTVYNIIKELKGREYKDWFPTDYSAKI
jgi:hypothetical protein